MKKMLEQTKEKMQEIINCINQQKNISPAELEHIRKSLEVIETVKRIESFDENGYSETSHRHMRGYSGHSVRDRIVSKLEKMLDDESGTSSQQTIRDILNIISRMSY